MCLYCYSLIHIWSYFMKLLFLCVTFLITASHLNSTEITDQSTGTVIINEIMYKSLKEFDTDDWIELYNPGEIDLNISGWLLKDNNNSRHFAFPSNTIIKKRDYLVIIESKNKFNNVHPGIENYIGSFTFGFGVDDMVRIYDSNLQIVDSVHYTNESPWHPETDGLGPSLELISHELDNTKPSSWRPSYTMHGTPGRPNSTTSVDDETKDVFMVSTFPNPVIHSMNIEFELAIDGRVVVEIYDLLGNKVSTVLDSFLPSGDYTTYWDGQDHFGKVAPAGIYIINVNASNLTSKTKIIKSN